jgi:glyoxylate carboligase
MAGFKVPVVFEMVLGRVTHILMRTKNRQHGGIRPAGHQRA